MYNKNINNMSKFLKSIVRSIIIIIGMLIILIYFFFEEKNDFFLTSKISEEENNRKTNFTKITNSVHKLFIFLVLLFLTILYLIPREIFAN